MSDSQDPVFAAIISRDQSDECRAHPGTVAPAHCLSFETPDGTHLVQLDSIGILPIPGHGETIVLHDQPVTVDSAETAYTRNEDGRPQIYTQVVVVSLQ
ncbi:hypothetical protein ACFV6Z_18625 [Streptomyces sp. NPDC059818]|uniref:hypothetical protein n=1 Tax=Streptomyces sp. NPDC059818 TaxID=3346962 RepID=UPI0036647EEB